MLAKLLTLITQACLSNSVPSDSEVAGVNGYVKEKRRRKWKERIQRKVTEGRIRKEDED